MAAFAAGLVFALVYEALRIVRLLLPFRVVTFLCDVLFFVLAAIVVTRLSLTLGNYIRGYTVIGFGAGIFCYITTLGRLLNLLENAVVNSVRAVLSAALSAVSGAARIAFGAIAHKAATLFGKINKISADGMKKLLNPLKSRHKIVYNKESHKDHNGGSEPDHVIKAQVRRSSRA